MTVQPTAIPDEDQPSKPNDDVGQLTEFVTDEWLANQLQMAIATIRAQRFKRRHMKPHWLDLDPVYIGSKPRYRRNAALKWIRNQLGEKNGTGPRLRQPGC